MSDEQMSSFPHDGDFVAFSMMRAQSRLQSLSGEHDYRSALPQIFGLGGINEAFGLVVDPDVGDIIIVGHHVAHAQPLTLDDLVVALRALFLHSEWPLVSLDPIGDPRDMDDLRVRFEGGVRHTQFGADLLAADWRLKKLALGHEEAAIDGVTSYWSEAISDFVSERTPKGLDVGSRFWLYPTVQAVRLRENVASIGDIQVGLFSEVFFAILDGDVLDEPTELEDPAAKRFAHSVTTQFDRVATDDRSVARTRGLMQLVALAHALQLMEHRPDLVYWLRDYDVREVVTPPLLPGLSQQRHLAGFEEPCRMYGGVQLRAMALRLKAGDVTALRDAVLHTKPEDSTRVTWTFLVDEWVVPTTPDASTPDSIIPLVNHAEFLRRHQRYALAREMYETAIAQLPDYAPIYNNLATVCYHEGNLNDALRHLNRAIQLAPTFVEAYSNRGLVHSQLSEHAAALADHNTAIHLNPQRAQSYVNRGTSHERAGEDDAALRDFDFALELNPDIYQAVFNKAIALSRHADRLPDAIDAFTQAIRLNPFASDALYARGVANAWNNNPTDAISDFSRAIHLDPTDGRAYRSRAIERAGLQHWDGAFADYQAALRRGLGTPFQHKYFTVQLPKRWTATANPEPGVEVGFNSADLPGVYWQVFLMPGFGSTIENRDPRDIKQGLQSQLLKQLPQASLVAKPLNYSVPEGTLFSIDIDWKLDGAGQYLRVVYVRAREDVIMIRAGHPHALTSNAVLPIAGLFSTFQVLRP